MRRHEILTMLDIGGLLVIGGVAWLILSPWVLIGAGLLILISTVFINVKE